MFLIDTSISPMQNKETVGQEEDVERSNMTDVDRRRHDVDNNRTRRSYTYSLHVLMTFYAELDDTLTETTVN
jgi:hypothetical protein